MIENHLVKEKNLLSLKGAEILETFNNLKTQETSLNNLKRRAFSMNCSELMFKSMIKKKVAMSTAKIVQKYLYNT